MMMRNLSRSVRRSACRVFLCRRYLFASCVIVAAMAARADENPEEPGDADSSKPTDVGIRLTPRIAEAMGKRFTREMTARYGLDDEQAKAIEGVFARRIMTFANRNAERGRDMIELMTAAMIENDGRFDAETARRFATMSKPLIPELKGFFTDLGRDLGQEMTVTQRLKLTADMTAAAAGVTVFETRMNRWSEGKVGDNANPFFDPADNDPSRAEPLPEDPNEHPDHRRARMDAERWMDWQLRVEEDWEEYVQNAVEYYHLNDKQKTSAQAILKECRDRLSSIRTTQWKDAVKNNRIARSLVRRSGDDTARRPWMFALDMEYERLRRPLEQLDEELKKRIDDLPDSSQRAAAREAMRKYLEERGLTRPPV